MDYALPGGSYQSRQAGNRAARGRNSSSTSETNATNRRSMPRALISPLAAGRSNIAGVTETSSHGRVGSGAASSHPSSTRGGPSGAERHRSETDRRRHPGRSAADDAADDAAVRWRRRI